MCESVEKVNVSEKRRAYEVLTNDEEQREQNHRVRSAKEIMWQYVVMHMYALKD